MGFALNSKRIAHCWLENTVEGSQDGSRETKVEAPAVIQASDDAAWRSVVAMEVVSIGVWIHGKMIYNLLKD